MQARSKAHVYAEAAGVTLGAVLSIREGSTSVQRQTRFHLRAVLKQLPRVRSAYRQV
jgi:uncharacterized protein YggE